MRSRTRHSTLAKQPFITPAARLCDSRAIIAEFGNALPCAINRLRTYGKRGLPRAARYSNRRTLGLRSRWAVRARDRSPNTPNEPARCARVVGAAAHEETTCHLLYARSCRKFP